MSVLFRCDGCGRTESGFWHPGGAERHERTPCHKCGESFDRLEYTRSEWMRPLVDDGKAGGGNYWWSRQDREGQQHACSRECIDKIAETMGVTRAVMPW